MRSQHRITISLLVGTLLGCHSGDIASPLTVAQLCARKDSLILAVRGGTIDDDFEILARLLPGGFGGLTTTYMFLKQPTLADTLRGTAKSLATCSGTIPPYLAIVQLAPVRQGDVDWIELRAWYRTLMQLVPATWHQADMNQAINRLGFAFTNQPDLEAFQARAVSAGVPAAALFLFVAPIAQVHLLSLAGESATTTRASSPSPPKWSAQRSPASCRVCRAAGS